MPDNEYPTLDNVAIASTGDPEEDQRQLDAYLLHEKRIAEDVCPNGDGILIWDTPDDCHCSVCKFVGHWRKITYI